jgi:hypothetical protein
VGEAPAASFNTGHSSELPKDKEEEEEEKEEEDNMSSTSASAPAASGLDSKLELLIGTFLGFDTRGPSGKDLKNALVTTYEQFMDLDPAMPLAFVYPNSGSNLESLPATAAHGMRNALAYHHYLESSTLAVDNTNAEDPSKWDKNFFRIWVRNDMVTFLNPSSPAGSSPPGGTSVAHINPNKKDDDDALTNWKRSKILDTNYDIITDDAQYYDWNRTFVRRTKYDGWFRVINPLFLHTSLRPGSDTTLFEEQKVFLSIVLDRV